MTVAAQTGMVGHIEICSNTTLAARSGVTKSITKPGIYWGTPAIPFKEEKKRLVLSVQLPKLNKEVKRLAAELKELQDKSL